MKISIIVAVSENKVIGNKGSIPWNIPEEQLLFKKITMGHTLIFGRKTYESIGRPLPGRRNIIITRQKEYKAKGCIIAHSLDQALFLGRGEKNDKKDIFIGGGKEIYKLAVPFVNRIYLTTIHKKIKGDTFFPDFPVDDFKVIHSESFIDTLSYSFKIYQRL